MKTYIKIEEDIRRELSDLLADFDMRKVPGKTIFTGEDIRLSYRYCNPQYPPSDLAHRTTPDSPWFTYIVIEGADEKVAALRGELERIFYA